MNLDDGDDFAYVLLCELCSFPVREHTKRQYERCADLTEPLYTASAIEER